jgi:predicted Ser/Thr protein kinase
MTDSDKPVPKCPRCGALVATDAPDGLCPGCLVALNFVTETEIPGEEGSPGTQEVKAPVPPAPSPEALASHFPQLEILEVLGRGGMGAVYKARQPNLDRFVALKILLRRNEEGRSDVGFAQRFAREARALARLNHPNIVAVYDYGEAGGYPFLVMEYVEGLTLRQLLQHGKLAPEEALGIVPRICEALQFAHQKGIVHRDIKPENILLDKSGQVKITDFGIAKVIRPGASDRSLTGAKDVVGTPHYMAPEQIEEPAKVDHRADIYSLGVVFYEMLTGELPLGKFQPPSNKVEVDVRLDEVVLRALAKEPERRYQQVSEVKTAVETITRAAAGAGGAGDLPKAEPPSAPPRWSRMAVWSAGWALLFVVNWVWSYTRPGWQITSALRDALGHWAVGLVMGPLAIVSFAAPVGVTVLGWMAVREIRRSQGRLHGLVLALADGVLFPLLLVDGWIMWLCRSVGAGMSGPSHTGATGAGILGVILAMVVDVVLIAWLCRRIQKPLPPLPASVDSADETAGPGRSWRKLIWKTVPRAALIGAVQLCLLETILQGSVHRPESTGELWYMGLLSSSLAAMVWAAWPLRRARLPVVAVGGGTLALFVALCGVDAFYSMRVRANLGLYEEDDWVSQHPGFQWGWRKGTASGLWSKPLAGPFAPTVEMVIPLGDDHPAFLLDLDTGRQVSRDRFDADDPQDVGWVGAQKLDLALVWKKQKITVLGLGLGIGNVPHFVPREELTPQAAVNFWLLDRKPAKECSDLKANVLGTFVFRTREGGVGFLELAGWSANPRGVKVRCKLVRHE